MNENSLELFSLLSDTPQVSKEEMQNAYKHFTEQIIAISQSEQSYHEIFRKLNITRIEFDFKESRSEEHTSELSHIIPSRMPSSA